MARAKEADKLEAALNAMPRRWMLRSVVRHCRCMVEQGGIPTSLPNRDRTVASRWGGEPFSPEAVASMRRTRRNPRPTQFDYLHLHRLVTDLAAALSSIGDGAVDVLDVVSSASFPFPTSRSTS